MTKRSPQMENLLKRYGVTRERDLVRAIQKEYLEEAGIAYSLETCEALLDQMLEAEYQRIEGGAYDSH